MNETAADAAKQPEQPQHQKHHQNRPQHVHTLLSKSLMSNLPVHCEPA
jgi:hypothetical protein